MLHILTYCAIQIVSSHLATATNNEQALNEQEDEGSGDGYESILLSYYYYLGIGFVCFCVGAMCALKRSTAKRRRKQKEEALPPAVLTGANSAPRDTPMLEIFVVDHANQYATSVNDTHPLERLLAEEGGCRFICALCADIEASNSPHIAHDLVLLLFSLGTTPQILENVLELEAARINCSSHTITLNMSTYPCNSNLFSPLLWKLVRKYAVLIGRPFLKTALTSVLTMADSLVISGETVSPESIQPLIVELVNNILDDNCARAIPRQIRRICRTIHSAVSRKFPGNASMAAGAVGRFMLSGLLTSGLLAPHAYGLCKAPCPAFSKIMLQIALVFHHMGQGTLFGSSNVSLKSFNPQILTSTQKIQKFLENMTKIDVQPQCDSPLTDLSGGGTAVTPALRQHCLNSLTLVVVRILPRLQISHADEKFMEYLASVKAEYVNYGNSTEVTLVADNVADIAYAEFERELAAATVASEETLARCLEELPAAVQKIVLASNIKPEELNMNFDVVLNILHFKKIYPPRHLRPLLALSSTSHFDVHAAEELITPGNPKRLYRDMTRIGRGGFGSVYVARNERGRRVALKRLLHTTTKEKRRNLAEVRFLSILKHDNIVQLVACHLAEGELWIVMEYMAGGTLTQAATSYSFTEEQISYVARELLRALEFIHSKGLVHRDVKSDNCMLSTKGEVKLIDFGLCLDIEKEGTRNHLVGSPFWMSPEMIVRKPHSYPTDIWSFAVCLLELANHHAPNKDSYIRAMFTVATVGLPSPLEQPGNWSPLFHDFLSECLRQDPDERLTATQLLQHPFIKQAATAQAMESLLSQVFVQNLLEQTGMYA